MGGIPGMLAIFLIGGVGLVIFVIALAAPRGPASLRPGHRGRGGVAARVDGGDVAIFITDGAVGVDCGAADGGAGGCD